MNFLNGKKTYIVSIGGVLLAVGGYLTGALSIGEAFDAAIAATLGSTVRHGIAKGPVAPATAVTDKPAA